MKRAPAFHPHLGQDGSENELRCPEMRKTSGDRRRYGRETSERRSLKVSLSAAERARSASRRWTRAGETLRPRSCRPWPRPWLVSTIATPSRSFARPAATPTPRCAISPAVPRDSPLRCGVAAGGEPVVPPDPRGQLSALVRRTNARPAHAHPSRRVPLRQGPGHERGHGDARR